MLENTSNSTLVSLHFHRQSILLPPTTKETSIPISVHKRKVLTMAKASSLAQNLAKELECAVCLEEYKEPKVLPCLHSYCKKCLEGLLTKQGAEWRLNCPSCRISVEVSSEMFDLRSVCLLNLFNKS